MKKIIIKYIQSTKFYTSLINGIIDAALWSTASTEYHTSNIYCDLMTVGVEFGPSLYQMPVKKDWLYTADLDSNIFSLIESEELADISKKWFELSRCPKNRFYLILKLN